MGDADRKQQDGGMLAYFGMGTREQAAEVCAWALPYVGFLAAALLVLSFLVQYFFTLPLWIHVVAIGLAVVYFFFFMARVRQMGIEAGTRVRDEDAGESREGD